MQIAKDTVVGMIYTLKDDEGKVLDSNVGGQLMYYLHGHGNIVPGLEKALLGKGVGDEVDVKVPAAEGYGEYDETRTFEVPKSDLGPNVKPQKGMMLNMRGPNGLSVPVKVLKVKLNTVLMDGNHQLAGQNLNFSVTIDNVRKAKKDEISHGHAHGPGGHKH